MFSQAPLPRKQRTAAFNLSFDLVLPASQKLAGNFRTCLSIKSVLWLWYCEGEIQWRSLFYCACREWQFESKHLVKVTLNLHLIGFEISVLTMREIDGWDVSGHKLISAIASHSHQIPSLIADYPQKPQSAINFLRPFPLSLSAPPAGYCRKAAIKCLIVWKFSISPLARFENHPTANLCANKHGAKSIRCLKDRQRPAERWWFIWWELIKI